MAKDLKPKSYSALLISRNTYRSRKRLRNRKSSKKRNTRLFSKVLLKRPNVESQYKINAANKNISEIDSIPPIYANAHTVWLGNNNITSCAGLSQLKKIQNLSLANNKIEDFKDFAELKSLQSLRALYLDGNPVVGLPNYREHVIEMLPLLQTLDGKIITENDRENSSKLVRKEETMIGLMVLNDHMMVKLDKARQRIQLHGDLYAQAFGRCQIFASRCLPAIPTEMNVTKFLDLVRHEDLYDGKQRKAIRDNLLRKVQAEWRRTGRKEITAKKASVEESWDNAFATVMTAQHKAVSKISSKLTSVKSRTKEIIQKRIQAVEKAKLEELHPIEQFRHRRGFSRKPKIMLTTRYSAKATSPGIKDQSHESSFRATSADSSILRSVEEDLKKKNEECFHLRRKIKEFHEKNIENCQVAKQEVSRLTKQLDYQRSEMVELQIRTQRAEFDKMQLHAKIQRKISDPVARRIQASEIDKLKRDKSQLELRLKELLNEKLPDYKRKNPQRSWQREDGTIDIPSLITQLEFTENLADIYRNKVIEAEGEIPPPSGFYQLQRRNNRSRQRRAFKTYKEHIALKKRCRAAAKKRLWISVNRYWECWLLYLYREKTRRTLQQRGETMERRRVWRFWRQEYADALQKKIYLAAANQTYAKNLIKRIFLRFRHLTRTFPVEMEKTILQFRVGALKRRGLLGLMSWKWRATDTKSRKKDLVTGAISLRFISRIWGCWSRRYLVVKETKCMLSLAGLHFTRLSLRYGLAAFREEKEASKRVSNVVTKLNRRCLIRFFRVWKKFVAGTKVLYRIGQITKLRFNRLLMRYRFKQWSAQRQQSKFARTCAVKALHYDYMATLQRSMRAFRRGCAVSRRQRAIQVRAVIKIERKFFVRWLQVIMATNMKRKNLRTAIRHSARLNRRRLESIFKDWAKRARKWSTRQDRLRRSIRLSWDLRMTKALNYWKESSFRDSWSSLVFELSREKKMNDQLNIVIQNTRDERDHLRLMLKGVHKKELENEVKIAKMSAKIDRSTTEISRERAKSRNIAQTLKSLRDLYNDRRADDRKNIQNKSYELRSLQRSLADSKDEAEKYKNIVAALEAITVQNLRLASAKDSMDDAKFRKWTNSVLMRMLDLATVDSASTTVGSMEDFALATENSNETFTKHRFQG